jgi:hypothetical protein
MTSVHGIHIAVICQIHPKSTFVFYQFTKVPLSIWSASWRTYKTAGGLLKFLISVSMIALHSIHLLCNLYPFFPNLLNLQSVLLREPELNTEPTEFLAAFLKSAIKG